jgi:hypothetical protein
MKQEPYATDKLLFFPGSRLSDEEKARMDNLEIPIDRLTIDHLIYSMGTQIGANFQTFYTVAEDVIGEEAALGLAREIGRRYGGAGYSKLLENHGCPGHGSPRMMALYQDLVHSIRGPQHAISLFGEYDENETLIRRPGCIYFSAENEATWKYTQAFEEGCLEAYIAVDENLERVENPTCRFRGQASCEHRFVFKPAPERE